MVFVFVLVVDQLTKTLLTHFVKPFSSLDIIPGLFSVVNVRNPGAAFGMFKAGGPLLLTAVSVAALLLIAYLLYNSRDRLTQCALAMIAGGAAGNLIDRIRFSEVVDFLDFYLGRSHWPAFNIADTAISAGVIIYLIAIYRVKEGD